LRAEKSENETDYTNILGKFFLSFCSNFLNFSNKSNNWYRTNFSEKANMNVSQNLIKIIELDKYKMLHWLKAIKNLELPTSRLLTYLSLLQG